MFRRCKRAAPSRPTEDTLHRKQAIRTLLYIVPNSHFVSYFNWNNVEWTVASVLPTVVPRRHFNPDVFEMRHSVEIKNRWLVSRQIRLKCLRGTSIGSAAATVHPTSSKLVQLTQREFGTLCERVSVDCRSTRRILGGMARCYMLDS